jgi:hypothetical protein
MESGKEIQVLLLCRNTGICPNNNIFYLQLVKTFGQPYLPFS